MEPILIAFEILCAYIALSYFSKAENLRRQAVKLGRRLGHY